MKWCVTRHALGALLLLLLLAAGAAPQPEAGARDHGQSARTADGQFVAILPTSFRYLAAAPDEPDAVFPASFVEALAPEGSGDRVPAFLAIALVQPTCPCPPARGPPVAAS